MNTSDTPFVVEISPKKSVLNGAYFKELWYFRELFFVLSWRDFKVRYKQTALGMLWVIIQPVLFILIITLILNKTSNLNTSSLPHPVFILTGLVFWNFAFNSINATTESLMKNVILIKKVYFPRILLPLSSVSVFIVDFIVGVFLLVGFLMYYQVSLLHPALTISMLLYGFIVCVITILGISFFLSALYVQFRDIKYVLPFTLQLMFFATPVIYSTTLLGTHSLWWFLNPFAGAIEGFRSSFSTTLLEPAPLLISLGVSIVIFISGCIFFNIQESNFADTI